MSATKNKYTLSAVCIGKARKIPGIEELTGICKEAVQGPVNVGKLGLEGDAVVNTEHHGGYDQAVYVFGEIDYKWWVETLGRELVPGTFGENLCIEGVDTSDMHVGDRLVFPDVELKALSPRIPCRTFTARMGDKKIGKTMFKSGHPGFYCSVVKPGVIEAGQQVLIERAPEPRKRIIDLDPKCKSST